MDVIGGGELLRGRTGGKRQGQGKGQESAHGETIGTKSWRRRGDFRGKRPGYPKTSGRKFKRARGCFDPPHLSEPTLETAGHFLEGEALDDVAFLDILEALEGHTALHAIADLGHFILEALEGL